MLRRNDASAFITPTMGTEPPVLDTRLATDDSSLDEPLDDDSDHLVIDASLAGFPACAIPIGLSPGRLPISMQIVAPRGDDYHVLAVAEECERAIGWSARQDLVNFSHSSSYPRTDSRLTKE
jgi:Asp-tRNA(Asn)/Glu-tRNA(Gln) amidotransferase A subunit family amidase